jgi:signal transduction histidine kinase
MILSNAVRLQQLFEKVTMLSNLRMGVAELSWGATDVVRLLREAAESAQGRFCEKGIKICLDSPSSAEIVTDAVHLEVALSALIDNAIRFSPDDGRVDIKLDDGHECLTIAVIDYGRGIAPTFLPRVFDELTVEDPDHHSGGQGLSLALSRAIVEALDGEIQVASSVGVETKFIIRLPKLHRIPLVA